MANVMVGQQIQLSATVKEPSGAVFAAGPVTWASSNIMIATVDANGLVKALALGQVTITAAAYGQVAAATIATTTGLLFLSVSAGARHTCGVTSDRLAYCWGDNSSGQLGNGTTNNSAAPVPVSGELIFENVSAGDDHTCGLDLEGVTYCWGDNSFGQLGDGTTNSSAVPVPVSSAPRFATVSAGSHHSCVSNGANGYCWGDNSSGQLGNGTFINSAVPVETGFRFLSAGQDHTCGIGLVGGFLAIPEIYCWGDNRFGELGDGTTTASATPVPGGPTAFSVTAGTHYTCSWQSSGLSYCWGNNDAGQLGNGTTINSAIPVAVAGGLAFTLGSAGGEHTCGVTSAGVAYCWGDNSFGQLGDGTTTATTKPIAVAGGLVFATSSPDAEAPFRPTMSAGGRHTCGITNNQPGGLPTAGAVYCWGDNSYGQLGNGWTTTSNVPVNVAGPP